MPKEPVSHIIVSRHGDRWGKPLAICVVIAAFLAAWYAVSWQIGAMLAELTPTSQPDSQRVAEMAVALAPNDPGTYWLLATKEKEKFSPESFDNASGLFEEVVRRSPYDYRWWIELGRANEQSENVERAEIALRRAAELAPNFTYPRWQLGNFYLRQNRTSEAFAELKKTTEGSLKYRDQVFSLAWDYFDKDPARVEEIAADTPDVRASLALFYAVHDSPADALRVWNAVPDEDKAERPAIGKTIAQGFFDRHHFRESLEFARQAGLDPDAKAETITNGGFEAFVGNNDSLFDWKVNRNDGKLDIATDSSVKHSGGRSIRFAFRGYAKPDLYNLSQFVAVEASEKYKISFWVRTENLRSGGGPRLEVADGNDGTVLAASEPFAGNSNEWQQFTLDILVPNGRSGIVIRTGRQSCADCPIFGTFWYDDLSLTKQ